MGLGWPRVDRGSPRPHVQGSTQVMLCLFSLPCATHSAFIFSRTAAEWHRHQQPCSSGGPLHQVGKTVRLTVVAGSGSLQHRSLFRSLVRRRRTSTGTSSSGVIRILRSLVFKFKRKKKKNENWNTLPFSLFELTVFVVKGNQYQKTK